ncbi:hypothetical protein Tdes44962_MAKER06429 [Teratosphaeria destructans]|uniref:Uncharacterized protein n=1 Tax=Teratosphaeria destructans TaxID=418781 RepID=A0A9W7T1C3_9PEZI|nr:hypothetical protein Tdes44962_MAKER06429 [Teratosphaeria destructans]
MKLATTLALAALSLPTLITAIPNSSFSASSTKAINSPTTTSTKTVLRASTTTPATSLDGSVMVRINLPDGDTFWVPRSIVTGFNAAPSVSAYIASYLATASPNATNVQLTQAKVVSTSGTTRTTTITSTSTILSTTTVTATATGGWFTLGYESATYTVPASVATGFDAADAISPYIAGLQGGASVSTSAATSAASAATSATASATDGSDGGDDDDDSGDDSDDEDDSSDS